ncbi:MAG TPA: trypsin-like peptidase domain-containing protein [Thermoguttaceae bacterium]|nr:trypsin-like peptidase domain-containing protein [Thermoguttaceae bacterium]
MSKATLIACLTSTLVVYGLPPGHVVAQDAATVAVERRGPVTAEQRAELYQTLEDHARFLDAQAVVVKTVAKLIGPTVVYIESDVSTPAGRNSTRHVEEAGSGVIIEQDDQYYVLTNRHVICNSSPEQIKINLADGRQIRPAKIWGDADTDIAVMRVSAPDLVAARLGDSNGTEVGDFVLAVGSPFGLTHSVTFGIVSAKGRRDLQLGDADVRFQDFLQTDASINPGNSGGPLVNLKGEIIGINSAIASNSGRNEGIGFAIPINMFMVVGRQLIERGKVTRAFLGVNLDGKFGPAMAAEIGLPFPVGARVTGITKGAPAESARLQVGDVILEFDRIPVEDDAHLVNLVGMTEVGKKVPLQIFRDRKTVNMDVVVGDRAGFERKE